MKIIVVGGSRGIGRQTVAEALRLGHEVTVFARRPEAIDMQHDNLRLQAGDVLDVSSVELALKGHDAVVCTLGLPTLKAIGPPLTKRSYVLSKGIEHILAAMAKTGTKRLLCVTAIGTGDSARQCTPVARLILRGGLRWLYKEKDRQEDLIKSSHTDWTIVRPTALTKGRKRQTVMSERVRSGILTHISRADVAAFMMNEISHPDSYRKAVAISYPPRLGDTLRWVAGYFGIG